MTGASPPPVLPEWCSDAPHLGMDGRVHRHRMGLRRLDPEEWLEPDAHASAQLALKAELLEERPHEVLHDAGTVASRRAVLDLARLLAEDPRRPGPAPSTDDDSRTEDVLRACALATQEDWCLMVREDDWRLRAACVCFPSRWVLAEKVGTTVAEIHDPVPRYDEQLRGLVEAAMDRLTPERPVWRVNWNLWDDPRLFQPTEDPAAATWPLPVGDEVGERVVLRVERQTLRRLPGGDVAFGIRVHQRPLRTLVDQDGAVELLHDTLEGLSGSPSGDKKLGRLEGPIREWVESVRAR
jgi:hypothetical protein